MYHIKMLLSANMQPTNQLDTMKYSDLHEHLLEERQ
jgi:hypothetical protein